MYMAMLYSDMFHIMSTAEAVLRMYIIRTLSELVLTGGAVRFKKGVIKEELPFNQRGV